MNMKKSVLILLLFFSLSSAFSQDESKQYLRELLPHKKWQASFYTDVLKSKDRNTALNYLPSTRARPKRYFEHLDAEQYWYEADYWPGDDIVFVENWLGLPVAHSYDVIDVRDLNNRRIFKVAVKVSDSILEQNKSVEDAIDFPWDLINTRSSFTFLFLFDRDFLDIFVDDFSKHFATFCRYNDETKQEIKNLINYNSYDEENVTWPMRESKNHKAGSSCIVIESLRLRKEESTASAILQTMDRGTPVKITALGKQQTIDGITANWVKVKLDDGTEGWCFGGYLVDITR